MKKKMHLLSINSLKKKKEERYIDMCWKKKKKKNLIT